VGRHKIMTPAYPVTPHGSKEPVADFAERDDALAWAGGRLGRYGFRIEGLALVPSVMAA
jgi:hypothetical protein